MSNVVSIPGRLKKVILVLALLLLLQLAVVGASQAAPAEASGFYHTVRWGENLSSIAWYYGTSVQAIMYANHIVNPNLIYAGTVLYIPEGGYGYPPPAPPPPQPYCRYWHTVTYGDNLSRIGAWYGVSPWAIAQANHIYNLNLVYVGQSLCIP
jgi:LysM repeat protein